MPRVAFRRVGRAVDRPNGKSPTRGNVAGFVCVVLARAVRVQKKKDSPNRDITVRNGLMRRRH